MTRYAGFGLTLGIVGGGQLGRMLVRKAGQMGLGTVVLDPEKDSPAGQLATEQIVERLDSGYGLMSLAWRSDIVTLEVERVPADGIELLADNGFLIHPSSYVLRLIQDKLTQKKFFESNSLPTSRFVSMDKPSTEALVAFGEPAVQKLRWGGYDGYGVVVKPTPADLLPGPSLLEAFVDAEMELAVMVARSTTGQMAVYPVVEMTFDDSNKLDVLIAPARIPDELACQAQELAQETILSLNGVGMFGVEMFYGKDGNLYLNEISPRVHNSGHYTIEACRTCQFEQHIRAVCGFPLGDTFQHTPAVLVNILGAPGHHGPAHTLGLKQVLDIPGLAMHMYAKTETRPGRKMGHVTIVDSDLDVAIRRVSQVRDLFSVVASD